MGFALQLSSVNLTALCTSAGAGNSDMPLFCPRCLPVLGIVGPFGHLMIASSALAAPVHPC